MKKVILIVSAIVFVMASMAIAQDKDWQEEYLKKEVELQQKTVELFSANQKIAMLEKTLADIYEAAGKARIDKARYRLDTYENEKAAALKQAEEDIKKHEGVKK